MRKVKVKFVLVLVLLALLLSASLSPAMSQEEPKGWWATTNPYRWEYVEGGHWLAVWSGTHGYDQHFVPGDWVRVFLDTVVLTAGHGGFCTLSPN